MNRDRPVILVALANALRFVGYIELSIGVVLVFFISLSIAASVVFRYALASPLIWVEEAVTISFIWLTLLGAAVAAKMDRHVTIMSFDTFLSEKKKLVLLIFVRLFVFCVSAAIAYFCLDYVDMQNRSNTVSLPLNFPRGWVFSIPTMLAMASIAATQVVLVMDSAVRLRRNGPPSKPLRIMDPLEAMDV